MSMYARELGSIPEETARVARAACPKGTLAMRLRDELGELYQDEHFVSLYPIEGQPAYEAWRLAIVTVLQYGEGLTDRQAANAVRQRIDWKYALGLELMDAGFDFSVLSEFRTRLVESQHETLLLDRLLEVCKDRGWLKAGGKQRSDSTHVLARVRSLSNLECVGETLLAVLDDLATLAPDWLVQHISPDWFERYSHRVENYRFPKAESQRTALAQQIGADGLHLLHVLEKSDAPALLKDEASVHLLRQVWQQYYDLSDGKAKWRAGPQESSDEGVIRSPYDPEARTGKKRETTWLGYKVHLSETCALETPEDPQAKVVPQLITDVQTTVANVQDVEMTAIIQENLAQHHLVPEEQIVDTGYVDGDLLVSSQQNYGTRWSVRLSQTTVGRPKQARALTSLISSSTGKPRPPPVHRVKPVIGGVQQENAWKWCLPERSVLRARYAATARNPRPPVVCYTYAHKRLMKRCRRDDTNKRHRSFGRGIRREQASRGRFPKPYEGWGYDEHAMTAYTKHNCSMW